MCLSLHPPECLRDVLQGWDWITSGTFHCFVKDIHKRDWLFFSCICMTPSAVHTTASICAEAPAASPVKCQPQSAILVHWKQLWPPRMPERVPGTPGVHEEHLRTVGLRPPLNTPGTWSFVPRKCWEADNYPKASWGHQGPEEGKNYSEKILEDRWHLSLTEAVSLHLSQLQTHPSVEALGE